MRNLIVSMSLIVFSAPVWAQGGQPFATDANLNDRLVQEMVRSLSEQQATYVDLENNRNAADLLTKALLSANSASVGSECIIASDIVPPVSFNCVITFKKAEGSYQFKLHLFADEANLQIAPGSELRSVRVIDSGFNSAN